jgi:hypothetical protein
MGDEDAPVNGYDVGGEEIVTLPDENEDEDDKQDDGK